MLVKISDSGRLLYFPNWIEENGTVYTNKAARERARNYGWKELKVAQTPDCDSETQYLAVLYTEEEDCVHQSYEVREFEEGEIM